MYHIYSNERCSVSVFIQDWGQLLVRGDIYSKSKKLNLKYKLLQKRKHQTLQITLLFLTIWQERLNSMFPI